ncbi:MAG: hypothetical protein AAGK22_12530 [Acidobacteriota bacterium]
MHSYTQSLRQQLRDTNVEVIEVVPPYVQTFLTGADQASDERAMPSADYIRETMAALRSEPSSPELIIDQVEALRFAERNGSVDELLTGLTAMGEELARF